MIETLYGVSFLGIGILIDQLGTYLVLSTLGIVVAAMYSSAQADRVSVASVALKVVKFPPLQALVLALGPLDFRPSSSSCSAAWAPLALVSVGYQLRIGDLQGRIPALTLGLTFKLIVGPILIAFVLVKLFGSNGPTTQVTIFEAAMGRGQRGVFSGFARLLKDVGMTTDRVASLLHRTCRDS